MRSQAIPIVNPNAPSSTASRSSTPRGNASADRKDIQCRNLALYGYCKFENKGCAYNHAAVTSEDPPASPPPKQAFANSFSAEHLNAPVFVPRGLPQSSRESSVGTVLSSSSDKESEGDVETGNSDAYQQFHQGSHSGYNFPNRSEFRQEIEGQLTALHPIDHIDHSLPTKVHKYHTIQRLDQPTLSSPSHFASYNVSTYRAISSQDGDYYVLKRIEGFRLQSDKAITSVEKWTHLLHPNLVRLKEAFTTRAFGDQSVIFVYEYRPGAKSQKEMNLGQETSANSISETQLWQYILQISGLIKCVHTQGLALRFVEGTGLLFLSSNRIQVNCCGMLDVVLFDGSESSAEHQAADFTRFGTTILSLVCKFSVFDLRKAMDWVATRYSQSLLRLLTYLLAPPSSARTIDDVLVMCSTHLPSILQAQLETNDALEKSLLIEMGGSRRFNLLCKLGFINERPEFENDPRWSDTGDRYLLKLFRDYVFHQVDYDGHAVLDLSHVTSCLNKLDAGTEEMVSLVNTDEHTCIIVSYAELKSCVQLAFGDLLRSDQRR